MSPAPDVIIIGGGIIGQAIAWETSKAGLNHTLLSGAARSGTERASLAAGAMLGALGEITVDEKGKRAEIELDYRLRAARLYPSFLQELTAQTGDEILVTRGTVVVANTEGGLDVENLAAIAKTASASGERAEWIDPKQVRGLQSSRDMRPIGCLFLPDEWGLDSGQLMHSLEKAAAHSGSVVPRDAVSVVSKGGGWEVTLDDGAILSAARVVLANGTRCMQLIGAEHWKELGLPKIFFGKGSSLITGQPDIAVEHVIRTPNRAFACGVHFVPRSAGRLYIGATNFFGDDPDHEAGIEAGELHILMDQAIHQLNVHVRRSKVQEMRYGFRPIFSTRKPIAGETKAAGLYMASGTYRNGVLMAPLMARHIAQEIISGKPVADNPYSPRLSEASPGDEGDIVSEVVETGLRDLAEILREPGGRLPYGRAEELATLVQNLWTLAFDDSARLSEFRATVKQRLQEVPLTETVNRLFYQILSAPLK